MSKRWISFVVDGSMKTVAVGGERQFVARRDGERCWEVASCSLFRNNSGIAVLRWKMAIINIVEILEKAQIANNLVIPTIISYSIMIFSKLEHHPFLKDPNFQFHMLTNGRRCGNLTASFLDPCEILLGSSSKSSPGSPKQSSEASWILSSFQF